MIQRMLWSAIVLLCFHAAASAASVNLEEGEGVNARAGGALSALVMREKLRGRIEKLATPAQFKMIAPVIDQDRSSKSYVKVLRDLSSAFTRSGYYIWPDNGRSESAQIICCIGFIAFLDTYDIDILSSVFMLYQESSAELSLSTFLIQCDSGTSSAKYDRYNEEVGIFLEKRVMLGIASALIRETGVGTCVLIDSNVYGGVNVDLLTMRAIINRAGREGALDKVRADYFKALLSNAVVKVVATGIDAGITDLKKYLGRAGAFKHYLIELPYVDKEALAEHLNRSNNESWKSLISD